MRWLPVCESGGVRTIDGREACVCATRNANEELDTADLGGVVGAAFGLVRKR